VVEKKRFLGLGGPPSVTRNGIRYQALRWGKERGLGQNGGYLLATRLSTGEELWLLKVYDVPYDADLEADKRDILITDIDSRWFRSALTVKNERGERFEVDLDTRQVRRLAP